MKKRMVLAVLAALMLAVCANSGFAATTTQNVPMSADIPIIPPTLNVTVYDIWPNVPWDPNAFAMDFGTLIFDPLNNIWRADHYHAIDAAVNSNNGAAWDLTIRGNAIQNAAGSAWLDDNINVRFVKVAGNAETDLLYSVYRAVAPGQNYNSAGLLGGWLRVYYGIATGSGDAPGALVIPQFQPGGHYEGTVQIILTTT